jgi:transcriptional regulator with XRE-family HTH domain
MTRSALARSDGRSPSYITQLENGDRTNPSNETIDHLATALRVDPRSLYVESPDPIILDRAIERLQEFRAEVAAS